MLLLQPMTVYKSEWYQHLDPIQQRLIKQSILLFQREKRIATHYTDYSFILFPMAKAYEGFLKDFLKDQGLLSEQMYQGRRFRIGRSLNPDIRTEQRDEWWLYDDVAKVCGPAIARSLWNAWTECRNHVFHYFVGKENELTLAQVEKKMNILLNVFEDISACKAV